MHNARRGDVRSAATLKEWRTDDRVVAKVTEPDCPVEPKTPFVVEAGHPGVKPA